MSNNLFDRITNLKACMTLEQQIKYTINKVLTIYPNDFREQMCHVYSTIIQDELEKAGIECKSYNLKDNGIPFDHEMTVVINKDKIVVIDLTYKQFLKKDNHELINFTEWPSEVLNKTDMGKRILFNLIIGCYCSMSEEEFDFFINVFKKTVNSKKSL